MIQNSSSTEKRLFHQEILKCPLSHYGCQSVFIGCVPLIAHLEEECNYFTSKVSRIFREELMDSPPDVKENLTTLIFNKVKGTPIMETSDTSFAPCKMQANYSLQTKKPDRFPRISVFKKLESLREFDESDNIELGSVPMKSNLACVFSTSKYKVQKTFIAFRLNVGFALYIREIQGSITKKLEGHKDHITEIKYFKNEREEGMLCSSSYDSSVIIWGVDGFSAIMRLEFGSWVISSAMALLRKQQSSMIFLVGGYYKKHPIKAYNLNTACQEFDLKVTENMSSEICETYVDEDNGKYYLFVGSDNNDKPKVVWYDFKNKTQLGVFPATANVTSIVVDFFNKSLSVLYSDSAGVIRQGDLYNGKIVTDFKSGCPVLDLLLWDNEYFIACGNPKDNSVKVYTRSKTRLVKSFDNNHNRVVVNVFKNFQAHNGTCLYTVGGDRKVKVQKLF